MTVLVFEQGDRLGKTLLPELDLLFEDFFLALGRNVVYFNLVLCVGHPLGRQGSDNVEAFVLKTETSQFLA